MRLGRKEGVEISALFKRKKEKMSGMLGFAICSLDMGGGRKFFSSVFVAVVDSLSFSSMGGIRFSHRYYPNVLLITIIV